MPPKGKGKQGVVATVPQYPLPAAAPPPVGIPLKAKSQGVKLVASNYGLTVFKQAEGSVDFIPRCGVAENTIFSSNDSIANRGEGAMSLKPLTEEQEILSRTSAENPAPKEVNFAVAAAAAPTPSAAGDGRTPAPTSSAGGRSTPLLTLKTSTNNSAGGDAVNTSSASGASGGNLSSSERPRKVQQIAAATGCTVYSLLTTQDGYLLEVGTLEDGGDLQTLRPVLTVEQVRSAAAAAKKRALAAAGGGAHVDANGNPMRRSGQLAALPPKGVKTASNAPSRASGATPALSGASGAGGAALNGAPSTSSSFGPEHGKILSVAAGAMHCVWVAIPPQVPSYEKSGGGPVSPRSGGSSSSSSSIIGTSSGAPKVFGMGCVEDFPLSASAAAANGVSDYTVEGEPMELECFSDESISKVWAGGSLTFAKGRRGLLAVGKLGDHVVWREPCLIIPALINQVSVLSPVEEVISVAIGTDRCYILMSNGDILVLEEQQQLNSSSNYHSAATTAADSSVPLWTIRNVTFELFPRPKKTRTASSGSPDKRTTTPGGGATPAAASIPAVAHGSGKKLKEIFAGKSHFVTMDHSDGTLYGWGGNSFGQLGPVNLLGLQVNKAVAVDLATLITASSSDSHTSSNNTSNNIKILVPAIPKPKMSTPLPLPEKTSTPTQLLDVPEAKQQRGRRASTIGKGTDKKKSSSKDSKDKSHDETVSTLEDSALTPRLAHEEEMNPPKVDIPSVVAATCTSWSTVVALSDGSIRSLGNY